ncbi:ABC transporter ATP-binding protein [Streptomyces ipomoeae]|uniref:ABC transporter ATP-binding protein n=1 Tax=Streptomyces ipomoeae TaxID=103232 RepID=A0AAE8VYV2_9ACTN|nr:ABC transporter ATP-binding protein [Streptomyces ipomoeae]TQE22745.1 ABC transporter ATP-binding protein [Streptomyces ipomoeae]TQE39166.1 ABC transporter ATP-binding protein [Streptomyces ipomoeae]
MTTTTPDGTLLSVRHLHVHATRTRGRPSRTLVRDVRFDLAAGQTLGIVGESGSGKTLTARAVMGVLADGLRAEGEVLFDGIPLLGRRERELRPLRGSRLAMVLQDPFTALNPLQTIGEHLRESLAPRARRDRATAAAEISRRLREVELDPDTVAGRYPFQLSGGMRQRVALAAALAQDPDLLIADEPTTALDVTTQAELLALLRRLRADRGMALVLITHDLRVAFTVCDRVLVMYAGSVLEDAPAAALARSPRHPYSLGLMLAEPPVSHYVDRLSPLPGQVPPADGVADRCAFADRCAWRRDSCVTARPDLVRLPDDRASACARATEIADELHARRLHPITPGTPPTTPGGAPFLVVDGLTKTYRRRSSFAVRPRRTAARAPAETATRTAAGIPAALREVSFELREGESLGVVGESGSGKTTLARCVLGLTTPSTGTIRLGGIDVSDYRRLSRPDLREVRRLVQIVFQDPYASLNPRLTIGATLREAVAARGKDHAADPAHQAAELLDLVRLPASYAYKHPGRLSGGERQRVAIARALAVRPKLLICDEPVAALDVSVQAQILELLREVRAAYGTGLILITHDLSVVRQMTDRVVVLRGGEIVESGRTTDALDSPRHPYTRRLLASIPGES